MHDFQHRFLELALRCQALRFGEFTLKSGRVSPYFFNAGQFRSGAALNALGEAYAAAIAKANLDFDMLFGPAYKGIPIATATAGALARDHSRDVPVAFNRKEPKDHGEGGVIIGAALQGRVLIVDDVISAGTSVRESVRLIEGAGATLAGVLVALDRQERGEDSRSAGDAVRAELGVPVIAVATLDDLLVFSAAHTGLDGVRAKLEGYRASYGAVAVSS